MKNKVTNIIIGAGPGGLACAKILAEQGRDVLVLERKKTIGPKVCAGGITFSGLLKVVPETLIEKSFPDQYVHTNLQHIRVNEAQPIIATINRKRLGQWMAGAAAEAGATILTGARVTSMQKNSITFTSQDRHRQTIAFTNLIGADGSTSIVRAFLGLSARKMGVGINYMVARRAERMQWHLNTRLFGSGYGWIFPHKTKVSIGAFSDLNNMRPAELKEKLLLWAKKQGYDLGLEQARAALVNSDFQGCFFGNIFLIGDAAGLASGLTGEGIYPAIVSGQAVAKRILDPGYQAPEIDAMAKKQKRHRRVIELSAKSPFLCSLLMEWLVLLLRLKLIRFHALEMAP